MSDRFTRTTHHVAQWVLRYVSERQLYPGDRLPSEHKLARFTGTGRSSVREALQLLAGQGLVEARPGKGYYLRREEKRCTEHPSQSTLAIEEIQDLTEARLVIEGACAALAALRAAPGDIARIESLLSMMEAKAASTPSVHQDALTLHLMIAEAAHNYVLSEMLRMIIPKIAARAAEVAAEIPDHALVDVSLHRELWAQIRTGNPEVARAAMETHIRYAASLYLLPYESRAMQEGARVQRLQDSPPRLNPLPRKR